MELSKFDMEASFYEMCETNFNYTVTLKFKRARNKTMLSLELGKGAGLCTEKELLMDLTSFSI